MQLRLLDFLLPFLISPKNIFSALLCATCI